MLSKSQHFETNGPLEGKKSLFKNDSDICMNREMVVNNEQGWAQSILRADWEKSGKPAPLLVRLLEYLSHQRLFVRSNTLITFLSVAVVICLSWYICC